MGDVVMSLTHPVELNRIQPFDYLTALLHHHQEVEDAPASRMPWNYPLTLARIGEDGLSPPGSGP